MIKDADEFGMTTPLPERGPMALHDISGMGVAVLILREALNLGMYSNNHLTFGSTRKRRGTLSSYYYVSAQGMKTGVLVKEEENLILIDSPTYSMWFERFIKGFVQ